MPCPRARLHSPLTPTRCTTQLLIIGAGPVGLLTALGAHARGCKRILITDQTRAFTRVGDTIDLQPNGMKALRLVAPQVSDVLRKDGIRERTSWLNWDVNGNRLPTISVQHNEEPLVTTHRSSLQRALIDALPKDVELRTNAQFVSYDYNAENGVPVIHAEFITNRLRSNPFAHWGDDANAAPTDATAGRLSVRAWLMIGADGINSCVREQVYRMIGGSSWKVMARAQYSGIVSFKGKGSVPRHAAEMAEAVSDRYLSEAPVCVVKCGREESKRYDAPSLMLAHMKGELRKRVGFDWVLTAHVAISEEIACKPDGQGEMRELTISQLREYNYPDLLVGFTNAMLQGTLVVTRPLYVVPVAHPPPYESTKSMTTLCEPPLDFFRAFGEGWVFLAGDSLHGMPPFFAQGTSMGLEDVVELVDLLADVHNWGKKEMVRPSREELYVVREKYRDARLERLKRVQNETLNRRSRHDGQGLSAFLDWVSNYTPVAKGWGS